MVQADVVSQVKNIFRRRGNVWEIVWRGDRFYVEHTDGMTYLHALIRGTDDAPPGTPIPIMLLRRTVLIGKTSAAAKEELNIIETLQDELSEGVNLDLLDAERDNTDSMMDDKSDYDIRRRRKRIGSEIVELNAKLAVNNIPDPLRKVYDKQQDALKAEDDFLRSELGKSKTRFGRKRKIRDHRETIRIAIKQAINRAIRNIAAASPKFGEYIRNQIHTGMQCGYRDGPNTPWET